MMRVTPLLIITNAQSLFEIFFWGGGGATLPPGGSMPSMEGNLCWGITAQSQIITLSPSRLSFNLAAGH